MRTALEFSFYAQAIAKKSTCLYQQVGAVVVQGDEIVGEGVNHNPLGWETCTQRGYCSVPGHTCGTQQQPSRAIHAELAAIAQAGHRARGATLYCTHKPCENCLKIAAAFGIRSVIYPGPPLSPEWSQVFM